MKLAAPSRVAAIFASALFAFSACGPGEETLAMNGLSSKNSSERAAAVRKLGEIAKSAKSGDDDLWVALERATRDPAAGVRIAAAESLATAPRAEMREADERGALADDALAAQLSDLDETVRLAAARVLGERCNARSVAYLNGAFARSGPAVRAQIGASLVRCGEPLEKIFSHAEEVRRMHALEKIDSSNSAWRGAAARDLGLLGRPDDVAKILPLLDDRDGTVAAAAAEGLGFANAKSAAPALQKLAGDEIPLIATAAIDALVSLGTDALAGAQPALIRQAQTDGELALVAGGALTLVSSGEVVCTTALQARVPAVAALLARGCPEGPFAVALSTLMKSVKPKKQEKAEKRDAEKSAEAEKPTAPSLDEETRARAEVLVDALDQTAPGASPMQAPGALALGQLCKLAGPEGEPLALHAADLIAAKNAAAAAPALLEVVKREKALLEAEEAARQHQPDDRAAEMDELAAVAAKTPPGDQDKIAHLMDLVKAHAAKHQLAGTGHAAARLRALLAAEPAVSESHQLLAAALRALFAVADPKEKAKARELVKSLRDDVDREVASAAREEPLPLAKAEDPTALAVDCFPDSNGSEAFADVDGGSAASFHADSTVLRAPSRAARRVCLESLLARLAIDATVAIPTNALESARATLWSDDGGERAAACTLLARQHDLASAGLRTALSRDPERRVRDACSATETSAQSPR